MSERRRKLKKLAKRLRKKYPHLCLAIKSNKKLCKKKARKFGRCKFHGGASLTGVHNPAYKHGKYVQNKEKFLERVEELKKDPNLKDLTYELSLMKGMLEATVKSKDSFTSEYTQKQIQDLIKGSASLIDTMKRVNEGYTLTVKNVNSIVIQVVKIIQNRVTDSNIRKQIAGDLRALHLVNN